MEVCSVFCLDHSVFVLLTAWLVCDDFFSPRLYDLDINKPFCSPKSPSALGIPQNLGDCALIQHSELNRPSRVWLVLTDPIAQYDIDLCSRWSKMLATFDSTTSLFPSRTPNSAIFSDLSSLSVTVWTTAAAFFAFTKHQQKLFRRIEGQASSTDSTVVFIVTPLCF